MRNLVQFINKHHVLILFILLEIFSLFLIIQNNTFHKSAFINSTNSITANSFEIVNKIENYFSLKSTNELLAEENAKLKTLLSKQNTGDNIASNSPNQHIMAMVINNSVSKRNNYLTLDKGRAHGIEKGMGVVTSRGVIGIIKEVSTNFASVLSILHSKSRVSVLVKNSHYFGSLEWMGSSFLEASVNDIPSHVELSTGDTIITSGYSHIFPANIPIGTITEIETNPNKNFHEIKILFLEDFKKLKFVYASKLILKQELNNLEKSNE